MVFPFVDVCQCLEGLYLVSRKNAFKREIPLPVVLLCFSGGMDSRDARVSVALVSLASTRDGSLDRVI